MSTDWIVGGLIAGVVLIVVLVFLFRNVLGGGSSAPFFNQVFSVAVSPADTQVRLLGDLTGLYRTRDGGRRWDRVAVPDLPVYSVVSVPKSGAFLAAGDGFLLRSDDAGATWRDLPTDLPALKVRALAVDPAGGQTLYAFVQQDGLYRSDDAARTWRRVLPLADASITSLAVKAGAPQSLFALHSGRGFVRSDDGGATFRLVTGGIPASRVTDVLTLAADPQTVYAVSGGTVYKSADGGETWQASNTGLQNVDVIAIARDAATGALYAADVSGQFWKSADAGKSWSQDAPS